MKYLKSYPIFENKILNPIEEYIIPLTDLGFTIIHTPDYNGYNRVGLTNLSVKLDNPSDELLSEIMSEYLSLIDRLKDVYQLNDYSITFSKDGVSILIDRDVKDVLDEFEMTPPQMTAYKSVLAALKKGEVLKVNRAYSSILFDKYELGVEREGQWIWIDDEGIITLPTLWGPNNVRVSNYETKLPFDERDIKWFKRIIDSSTLTTKEFNTLHRSSQEKLRELYK